MLRNNVKNIILVSSVILLLINGGCKKLVEIDPPANSITTSQVFTDSSDMAAAIAGIYSRVMYTTVDVSFCNGAQTVYCGLSSDELVPFEKSGDAYKMYINDLLFTNDIPYRNFWMNAYEYIYQANACIEGIEGSNTVAEGVKKKFLGEAKFFRALFYFYMINLFGDVPYITSTAWATTSVSTRTQKDQIYQQIIADLKDAQVALPQDYLLVGGKRTRATSWAATALLARVYLYTEDWNDAELQASTLIDNPGLFTLSDNLDDVFSINSQEAILQWQLNTDYFNYDATPEGLSFVARDGQPPYYISEQLLGAFESGDERRAKWVDSINYNGNDYFLPYKYKIGTLQRALGNAASEYYTVFRLAEMYLIRAESRAKANKLNGAIEDLNRIRSRSQLSNLAASLSQPQILAAISQERRIELFAEWGHRWLDLKRTKKVDEIMSDAVPKKFGGGTWKSFQQLYPIPQSEIVLNPNLTQNSGY